MRRYCVRKTCNAFLFFPFHLSDVLRRIPLEAAASPQSYSIRITGEQCGPARFLRLFWDALCAL